MMRLSKNGIKTLKKQYKSVLLKCLIINAGLFMLAMPAMAADIPAEFNYKFIGWDTTRESPAYLTGEKILDGTTDTGTYGQGSFSNLTIKDGAYILSTIQSENSTYWGEIYIGQSSEENKGNLTVEGGTIYVEGMTGLGVIPNQYADINIKGGTIIGRESKYVPTEYQDEVSNEYESDAIIHSGNGDINISGGEIDLKDSAIIKDSDNSDNASITGNINISGGNITLDDADIYSVNKILITGGTFDINDAEIKSGDDDLEGTENNDMLIQNSSITAVDSDIESTHNITIKNADIKLSATDYVLDNGGSGVHEEDSHGISAGNDINVENSTIEIYNTYLEADGKIELSGSETDITMQNATLKSIAGDVTINDGSYTLKESSEIKAHDGTLAINGGTITADGDYIEIIGQEVSISENAKISLKNGAVLEGEKSFTMNGGEFSLDNGNIYGDDVQILGGKINAQEGVIASESNIEIKSGSIDIKNTKNTFTDYKLMPNGMHMAGSNVGILAKENLVISGGEITLETSLRGASSVKMTDGVLNLNTTRKDYASTLWSKGDIELTGGIINLKSSADDDGSNITTFISTDETDYIPGNIILSGATINVEGEGNMLGTSGKIVMSDGEINIKENSELTAYSEMTEDAHVDEDAIATIEFNGGTINLAGELEANIEGNDKGLINFNNSNAVIEGDVESPSLTFNADHSLSKAITGEIGSLDKLTVAKGTLSFDKEPTDTITTVEVASGATLDIGLNTLHSTGDKADGEGVIFKDNSTLKFTATSADTHGQIRANYVNISENGTTLDMTFNGAALAKDESMTIQLFDQSEDEEGVEIEGKFANLTNNARYEFTDEGNGVYKITSVASASDVIDDKPSDGDNSDDKTDDTPSNTGENIENIKSVAEAWDNLDTGSVKNETTVEVAQKLAELSNNATTAAAKQAYKDALTALAPETAPAVTQTANETVGAVFNAVGSRLSGGSIASSNQGMSSGDALNGVSVWVQGMFNHAKFDGNKHAKGFDSDTWGTALGVEKQINRAVKAGVGYAYSKTDIDGFMRDTDVKTHTALVYGEYKPSNWYVNAVASYGWSDYEEDKNVSGINVKSKYDVDAIGLQAMTGYDMNINGYNVTPEVGLRYVHVEQDTYTDTAGQRVKSKDSDTLTGVVGSKFSKSYALDNGILLKPEVKAAMTYDISHDNSRATVTLVNGSVYNVSGKPLNRFGVEVGAGLTAELNDNVELSLGYEGKFRKDYQDHTGLINAKYKF